MRQDRRTDHGPSRWLQRLSGPGLALLFLTGTFAAIDWLMSLEPHWSSTIYGCLVIVGEALATLAMMVAVVVLLSAERPMAEAATPDRLNDLGNLMLAFTMLWAYMSFSQYLIIWSGNLPEEIPWYLRRTRGGWQWVALALILFHFFLPFFVLLFRENKRQSRLIVQVAILDPGDALARPGLAGRPGVIRPGQPANPLGRAAAEPGGDARGRGRLHGVLHRAFEGPAADPAQRPEPERGDRARRRPWAEITATTAARRSPRRQKPEVDDSGRRIPGAHRRVERGHEPNTIGAAGRSSSSRSRLFGTGIAIEVVLGLVMQHFANKEKRLDLLYPGRIAIDVDQFPKPRLQENPAVELARMRAEEQAPRRCLRMGRPQGRDRPHPHRASDGHPRQDGPAQGRRARARRGRAAADTSSRRGRRREEPELQTDQPQSKQGRKP